MKSFKNYNKFYLHTQKSHALQNRGMTLTELTSKTSLKKEESKSKLVRKLKLSR